MLHNQYSFLMIIIINAFLTISRQIICTDCLLYIYIYYIQYNNIIYYFSYVMFLYIENIYILYFHVSCFILYISNICNFKNVAVESS